MGVSLTSGRDFTDAEGFTKTAVAVINATMARVFWGERPAIGSRFRVSGIPDWFTVIGIAPDLKLLGVTPGIDTPRSMAFVPYAYQQSTNTGLTIRVKTGDPTAVAPVARAVLRASDPNVPITDVNSMEQVRRLGFWDYTLYGWIFGTIGLAGLLLASIGVYGVLSYSVAQRTQEIGVRMALGADERRVLMLVIRHGLWLTGIGVAIGLALAPLGTYAAQSLLFRVGPFDPITFTVTAAVLIAVAGFASYIPARRATKVDPVQALRGE